MSTSSYLLGWMNDCWTTVTKRASNTSLRPRVTSPPASSGQTSYDEPPYGYTVSIPTPSRRADTTAAEPNASTADMRVAGSSAMWSLQSPGASTGAAATRNDSASRLVTIRKRSPSGPGACSTEYSTRSSLGRTRIGVPAGSADGSTWTSDVFRDNAVITNHAPERVTRTLTSNRSSGSLKINASVEGSVPSLCAHTWCGRLTRSVRRYRYVVASALHPPVGKVASMTPGRSAPVRRSRNRRPNRSSPTTSYDQASSRPSGLTSSSPR